MKLTVTIYYEAGYRNQLGPNKSAFYEHLDLEIAEATSNDAPVATTTRWNEDTRWFNGRHFLVRKPGNAEKQRHHSTKEIIEFMEHGSWVSGISSGYDCFDYRSRAVRYSDIYEDFDYNARHWAIEEATQCLSRLLLLDGEFWVECAEPYLLKQEYGGFEVSHDIQSAGSSSRPNHRNHGWLLNADVLRADDPAAGEDITVLIPESIKRQPERDTILDAAKFLLEDFSYSNIEEIQPLVLSAISRVHSLVYGRERDEVDCDALVDPLAALVDAIEKHEHRGQLTKPSRMEAYRRCIERWVDRDMSIKDILPAQSMPAQSMPAPL